ncbi:SMP-30/gluconolactonase/LRE family protein [Aeromicrobium sp. YIM 150415]|nr:SMP-30/gluconolactonase/LRE family protein [Aeromicrobium sp. YIM 150415]
MSMSANNSLILPPEARLVAGGLGFTEGPALLPSGEVAVVSINRGRVYAVSLEDGAVREVVETGGGPNCVAVGTAGRLWISQNGGTAMPTRSTLPARPSIQCLSEDGLATVADEGLLSPSDCEIGPDGRLWFTDPAGHMDSDRLGALRSLDPETGELTTHLADLHFPNGLAFGHGVLYMVETLTERVRRFEVDGDVVRPDGWQIDLPGAAPDGIAVDSAGWLWVAASRGDALLAYDEHGALRASYDFGVRVAVTSVCFAGPGLDTLVITVAKGGSVIALPAPNPGLPVPVWSLLDTKETHV